MKDEKNRPVPENDEVYDEYYDLSSVASATSYTNLTPTPPHNEWEAESYSELWSYPKLEKEDQRIQECKKDPE